MITNLNGFAAKRIAGESKSVEYDDELELWLIVGDESGFAYDSYVDEESAENHCEELNEMITKN